MQRCQDVVGITGGGRQARVLEAINPGREAATDFVGAMRVRYHRKFVGMRFVHHRLHFLHRHLILIDKLDDVDAGVVKLFDLRFAISRPFHAPAKPFCPRIRLMLNERTSDIEGRARNFAAVDSIAGINALLQGAAKIARAGNACHE